MSDADTSRHVSAANGHAPASVAIVGGGLAGLAAAAALCQRGLRVELFEARRRLGGRAGSLLDARSGEWIDGCQHLALGCCTNLADFCRRTGTAECWRRQGRLHFVGPDGARYRFAAAGWLPAPFHLMPALLCLGYLSLRDRLRILRTMGRLARLSPAGADDRTTIGQWLRRQGESDRALSGFWSVILTSALGETLERASLGAARKVLVDALLASRHACELVIPQAPLAEIFDRRAGDWLAGRGVTLHRGTRIRAIEGDGQYTRAVVLSDGSRRQFDFFVLAVPWRCVRAVLAEPIRGAVPPLEGLDQFEPGPITAVHLWYDRPITPLCNAVLVGRLGQWLFRPNDVGQASPLPAKPEKGLAQAGRLCHVPNERAGEAGRLCHDYCQVVISASRELVGASPRDVADRVAEELAALWPAARRAKRLHWRVITHPAAVFSPRPGIEFLRPSQQTPLANLALAGDWTATGWPATMEGAVRSGYLAAEAILRQAFPAREHRVLVADLPCAPLARSLIRPATARADEARHAAVLCQSWLVRTDWAR